MILHIACIYILVFLSEQEVGLLSWGLVLEPSLDDQGPSHGLDRTVCIPLRLVLKPYFTQLLLLCGNLKLWAKDVKMGNCDRSIFQVFKFTQFEEYWFFFIIKRCVVLSFCLDFDYIKHLQFLSDSIGSQLWQGFLFPTEMRHYLDK